MIFFLMFSLPFCETHARLPDARPFQDGWQPASEAPPPLPFSGSRQDRSARVNGRKKANSGVSIHPNCIRGMKIFLPPRNCFPRAPPGPGSATSLRQVRVLFLSWSPCLRGGTGGINTVRPSFTAIIGSWLPMASPAPPGSDREAGLDRHPGCCHASFAVRPGATGILTIYVPGPFPGREPQNTRRGREV